MNKLKNLTTISVLFLLLQYSCNKDSRPTQQTLPEEVKIKQIHQAYVNGWLKNDEAMIMDLIEENSMIQPNRLTPIQGKENIRNFWFPKDSSETIIHRFETEMLSIHVLDTIAIGTHSSLLDWTYKKDTSSFGMIQKGFNTTVYRKQEDDSWKIWRSMWTDISAENK